MKKALLFLSLLFVSYSLLYSQTTIPGGNIEGVWTASGSPYLIQGHILIQNGNTLTIEPGVTVNFQGYYKLFVNGRILALGSESDTIVFTAENSDLGWEGIYLQDTPATNDSSIFNFCKIQNGKSAFESPMGAALYMENYSKVRLSNCRITNNNYPDDASVLCYGASPLILNCTFNYNFGSLFCYESSYAIIKNNIFKNNTHHSGGGIRVYRSAPSIINNIIKNNNSSYGGGINLHVDPNYSDLETLVKGNIISNNHAGGDDNYGEGGGIYISACDPNIIGNIISNNTSTTKGGGIYCEFESFPIIINSTIVNNHTTEGGDGGGGLYCNIGGSPNFENVIIYGNSAESNLGNQVFLSDNPSDPNFKYCNIQGGSSDFYSNGFPYTGEYINNIDENPLFTNPSSGAGNEYDGTSADWSLQANSPCIDAGNPTGDYPDLDILGNPRVVNDIIDMGAIEFQGQGNPMEIAISAQPTEICSGENSQLTTTATGGSENYTYSWTSTPEGFSSDISNPNVSPIITTTYHVEVSDGITNLQESVIITVNPFPADAGEITGSSEICQGEDELSYSIEAIENATSYSWTLPEGFNMVSGGNTNSITIEASETAVSGGISVVGVNDCGDGVSSSLEITVHQLEISAGEDQNISHSSSTTLIGSATEGSGDYNWQWQPANLLEDANVQNPITIILTEDTEFTLEVTDNITGCTSTDIVNIAVGDPLEIEIVTNPTDICFGVSLILETNVSGGSDSYLYSWTSYPEGFTSSEASPTISPSESLEYIVEVDDGLTVLTASVTITVIQLVEDAEAISGPQDICLGTSDIAYSIPVINYADSYEWTLPAGFIISNGNNTNSISVSVGNNAENGSITVKGINDCGEGNEASLNVNIHNVSVFAGDDQTIINGTDTQLEGSATEGSGDYFWAWEPFDLLNNPNIYNPMTTELSSTTTYNLTVTDNTYGCSSSDEVVVFVENGELVVIASATPDEIEEWEDTELLATVTGGTGENEYTWTTNPVGFQSNLPSFITSPNYTTIYTVEVTDGESSAQSEVTVTVFAAPAIPNQPIGSDTIELSITTNTPYTAAYIPGALTYEWSLSPETAGEITSDANDIDIEWNTEFSGYCYLSVKAINEYGESDYSETLEIYIDYIIGLPQLELNNISVYPNPGQNQIQLNGVVNVKHLSIKDISGKTLLQGLNENNQDHIQLDISQLPNGLYFIIFENGKVFSSQKLIKM